MSKATEIFMLGFRNAFSTTKLRIAKPMGQSTIDFFEKRRVLIEKERDRRKASASKEK